MPIGGRKYFFYQAKCFIVVFQTPAGVNCDAEIAAHSMFSGNRFGFGRSIDPAQIAARQRHTGYRGIIRGELNAFEPIREEALVALQALEIRPFAIGRKIDEVVEIQINPKFRWVCRAVVEKTMPRCHFQAL
jgi:hypothetical protein